MAILPATALAEDWVYSVRAGDTLWGLCRQYTTENNCWQKIGPYNKVDFPRSLAPGTRIRFPVAWLKAQPIKVEIIYIKGEVLVIEGEVDPAAARVSRSAKIGDTLVMGTSIQTEENSSTSLKFADGSVLVMEEKSHITFDKLSQHGATGMVDTRINLNIGGVKTTVPKRESATHFRVSTPSAVAAVRGTDFRIRTVNGDTSEMLGEVYDGTVNVNNPLDVDGVDVARAFGIKVEQNQPLMQPKALLPGPELLQPVELQSSPVLLQWRALADALNYTILVLADSEEEKLIDSVVTDNAQIELPLETGSCYKLSLSAQDQIGLRGMPTAQRVCVVQKPEAISASLLSNDKKQSLLKWEESKGAQSYRVEVSAREDFSKISSHFKVDETEFDLKKLPSRKAYVRVIPVSENGMDGDSSNVILHKPESRVLLTFSLFAMALIALF